MRGGMPLAALFFAVSAVSAAPGAARAQDDEEAEDPEIEEEDDDLKPLAAGPSTRLGVGVRIRQVFLPEGLIELFLEDVPSGVSKTGFGLEVTRRKGNFDIVFALEYSSIQPDEGLYLEKGDTPGVPGENPDFVEYPDGFSLLGADATFVWHSELHERVALRYGAGIGVGFVLGEVRQTDTQCTSMDIRSCTEDPNGEQVFEKNDDIPPVVPIVHVLFGARFKIVDQLTVNLEGGFRDLFYFGLGTTYLF